MPDADARARPRPAELPALRLVAAPASRRLRAVRLWGERGFVQYDASRVGEYAYVMKDVGLTRHRDRRDDLAPHAEIDLVRSALGSPGARWPSVGQVVQRTELRPGRVWHVLRAMSDFRSEIVRCPVPSRSTPARYTTRRHFVQAAPWWLRLLQRVAELASPNG